MKLASLKGGRDGQLAVVSRNLMRMQIAGPVAATLQEALDNWSRVACQLADLYDHLNGDVESGDPFDPAVCAAPLPRAYQWADGSAYVNHVALVRKARGSQLPERFWREPLIYQGGSDSFLGPRDPIPLGASDWSLDFEAELAVITDDVAAKTSGDDAGAKIRLFMLVNDISLRGLIPAELAKGFGFFQSKPSSAFSPVAVTPDELTGLWDGQRVHAPLLSNLNGVPFGKPDAGKDMIFSFPDLIAHAAKTRSLSAGTIIGSGTVSNKENDGPGRSIVQGGVGYSCIAEQRMVETILDGTAKTPYLKAGDQVRIEMLDPKGESIFGAIDQRVLG